MRGRLLAKNTIASLIAQITAIVCGFILPRFFLEYYGSDVNGLINSITQFLGIISFLELGVGAVVQSSLYKPLAEMIKIKLVKLLFPPIFFFID